MEFVEIRTMEECSPPPGMLLIDHRRTSCGCPACGSPSEKRWSFRKKWDGKHRLVVQITISLEPDPGATA